MACPKIFVKFDIYRDIFSVLSDCSLLTVHIYMTGFSHYWGLGFTGSTKNPKCFTQVFSLLRVQVNRFHCSWIFPGFLLAGEFNFTIKSDYISAVLGLDLIFDMFHCGSDLR